MGAGRAGSLPPGSREVRLQRQVWAPRSGLSPGGCLPWTRSVSLSESQFPPLGKAGHHASLK